MILRTHASTVRTDLAGLQYWHLLSGFQDWAKWPGRHTQALRIISKRDVSGRNYHLNLVLMTWAYSEFGRPAQQDTSAEQGDSARNMCFALQCQSVGFFFLMWISEMGNLRMIDIRVIRG